MPRRDAVPSLRRRPTPVAAVTHSSAPTSLHPPDARATISSSHHTAAVLPLHSPADDLIRTQHTTVLAPPSQHPSASADPFLHRSVVDMPSIHHAPTAADYLHPTAALASTYRHAATSLRPPTAPAFNYHPTVNAFHTICLSSTTCFCTSFFSASASISTLPLLVVLRSPHKLKRFNVGEGRYHITTGTREEE